jgi:hypothetical protein
MNVEDKCCLLPVGEVVVVEVIVVLEVIVEGSRQIVCSSDLCIYRPFVLIVVFIFFFFSR